jgi:hypothetical protein
MKINLIYLSSYFFFLFYFHLIKSYPIFMVLIISDEHPFYLFYYQIYCLIYLSLIKQGTGNYA